MKEIRDSMNNGQWAQAADLMLDGKRTKPAKILKVVERLLVTSQSREDVADVARLLRAAANKLENGK